MQKLSMMRAARLHTPGGEFLLDRIPRPSPLPGDVLVKVGACCVIPNLKAVVSGKYWHTLPPLPAVYGLDVAGVVDAVGDGVVGIRPGQRVYVNPVLYCRSCAYCRAGTPLLCTSLALRGYFGYSRNALPLMERYPYGGFSEFVTAAADSLVPLADSVSLERAARFGYMGTAYAALERAGMRAGQWVMVNGGTGTLGVGAVLIALGMGASRVLATGRNTQLLDRLAALDPARVHVHVLGSEPVGDWVRRHTGDMGPDIFVDCLGRGAGATSTREGLAALKRGGRAVNIGALAEGLELDPTWFMLNQISYVGSNWFTTAQAVAMAGMAAAKQIDLSPLQDVVYPLSRVNEALEHVSQRPGGFANVVVVPD
jgi:alcohol dehydrogenase